jgi:hypothetical protein
MARCMVAHETIAQNRSVRTRANQRGNVHQRCTLRAKRSRHAVPRKSARMPAGIRWQHRCALSGCTRSSHVTKPQTVNAV